MTDAQKLSLPVTISGEGETDSPAPDRLIAGNPVFTTWNLEERDGLYAGIWRSTPGKWRVIYDEWEYFRILDGVSVLTGDDGSSVTLKAGDAHILRPGFAGTWEVVETTTKDYVIRL
ncbi:cupin domain-containing protein [Shimia biformata]|uniref:cupin domain-containing protein n=1 Tax=Shimia biformata TaxID=1294299 RepID=UPI00194EDA0E|nr:cupin domain-containing protein [Shimia biformata]